MISKKYAEPHKSPLLKFFPAKIIPDHPNVQTALGVLCCSQEAEIAAKAQALYELCEEFNETRLEHGEHVVNTEQIYHHYKTRLRLLKTEVLMMVLLDHKFRYLGEVTVGIGGPNSILTEPREIIRVALQHGASAYALVHNHPSGSAVPSPEDKELTQTMRGVAKVINLFLLDHIIIGEDNYCSIGSRIDNYYYYDRRKEEEGSCNNGFPEDDSNRALKGE